MKVTESRVGYSDTRSLLFIKELYAAGFLERIFGRLCRCTGCLRYQFTFYKSPNVIRLKEFSKKYENFLFVEVINNIFMLLIDGLDI